MGMLLVLALFSPLAILIRLLTSGDSTTEEGLEYGQGNRDRHGPNTPTWLAAAPWAPLPALLAALFLPEDLTLDLPWLFLGTLLRLDRTARIFLALTATVWLAAGWYARGYLPATGERPSEERRFWGWFLATMGGNLLLIPCQDMVSFTVFFTVMSLSAYGLVIHHPSAPNRAAGRAYLALAILGEVVAFAGLVWACRLAQGEVTFAAAATALAAGPSRDAVLWLLIAGFGIKLGLVPLHVWLPLAHPAAPTPASAVLSGVIIKTGLLLWLRLFPWGTGALLPGSFLVLAGLTGTFGAALAGLTQTNPKALLAYSSVSQMGFVALAAGLGLRADAGSGAEIEPLLICLGVFTVHHGLTKGALFLGVGLTQTSLSPACRRIVMGGLGLLGASLAGCSLTSGQAAKALLKGSLPLAGAAWQPTLEVLVPLSGVTTMLLLLRFLALLPREGKPGLPAAPLTMLVPWAGLLLGMFLLPVALLGPGGFSPATLGLTVGGLGKAALPPLAALAMAAVARRVAPSIAERLRACLEVPPGDLLHLVGLFVASPPVPARPPTLAAASSDVALPFLNDLSPPSPAHKGVEPIASCPLPTETPQGSQPTLPLSEVSPPRCSIPGTLDPLLPSWGERPVVEWVLAGISRFEGFSTGLLLMVLLAAGLAFLL